jgi:hypothetical protein
MSENAWFCPGCGRSGAGGVGVAAAEGTGPVASSYAGYTSSEPLEYEVFGDNLQVARLKLKPGQELFAEGRQDGGKTPSVTLGNAHERQLAGEKLWGALKRKVMGESLFLTYFRSSGNGEVV